MRFTEIISETKPGLWANIHAKQDRIKHGSGEKMRKPGSKGAPSAQDFKDSANEAANPAQQAAIAVNMKKHHQKPKGVAEGLSKRDQQDVAAIRAAIARLESQLNHPNADRDAIQQSIAHEKKRLALYGQGVAEGSLNEFAPYDHNDDGDYDDEDEELRSLYDAKFELEAELDYADEEDREHLESELEDVHARILELKPDAILEQDVAEGENWSKHNNKRAGGMSKKSVSVYRREHPGSKIQTAVTTKPSKLKKGSKAAKRRASFCARMRGMKKHRTSAKTAHDPNSNINKSLRRWHCESIEELHELVMLAEQFIRNNKK